MYSTPYPLVNLVLKDHKCVLFIKNLLNSNNEIGECFPAYDKPMLHYAVDHGSVQLVNFLLQNGADVNTTCSNGQTALHVACSSKIRKQNPKQEHYDDLITCVRTLLQCPECDVNCFDNKGCTPLYLAVRYNDAIPHLLLQAGADVEATHEESDSNHAIHQAAYYGNISTLKLLLEHGAFINAQNCYGSNAIMYLLELIKELYRISKNNFGEEKVQDRLEKSLKMLNALLKLGCSATLVNNMNDSAITDMIHQDPYGYKDHKYRELQRVTLQLLLNDSNINALDNIGQSTIHYAILSCHPNSMTLEILIDLGCDVNNTDYIGRTCLHLIPVWFQINYRRVDERNSDTTKFVTKSLEMYSCLLSNNASVTVEDINGRTPLHYAVELAPIEIVTYILSSASPQKINVDSKDKTGLTALHIAASNNDCKLMELLLQYGACVNTMDHYQSNALHFACFTGATDAVRMLIVHKADYLQKDITGKRPIDVAKYRHFVSCVKIIDENEKDKGQMLNKPNLDGHDINVNADHLDMCVVHSGQILEPLKYFRDIEEKLDTDSALKNSSDQLDAMLSCYYSIPGVGLVDTKFPGVADIAGAIISMLELILVEVGKLDPYFKCTLKPGGSFVEQTKVGDPDEFDFLVILEYFSNIGLSTKILNSDIYLDFTNLPDKKFLQTTKKMYLSEGKAIMELFKILFCKAIAKVIKNIDSCLQVISVDCVLEQLVLYWTSLKEVSCILNLIWNGPHYKCLPITVDVVPCVAFSGWPTGTRTGGYLLERISEPSGYYLLPLSLVGCRASFASVENQIMTSLPDHIFRAFVFAKMIRNSCFIPFYKVYTKENHLGKIIKPSNMVSSYKLKTILFHLLESQTINKDSSSIDCLRAIYQVDINNFTKDEDIEGFFRQEDKVCSIQRSPRYKTMIEHMYELILQYLQNGA